MKNVSCPLLFLFALTAAQAQTDRVGVGTTTPRAGLDVQHNDGLVISGDKPEFNIYGEPDWLPGSGRTTELSDVGGSRLIWVPSRAAFRLGANYGEPELDQVDNFGFFSFAAGVNAKASADASVSLGYYTNATGVSSVALGRFTQSVGFGSFAMGNHSSASNGSSAAIGHSVHASGTASMAMGSLVKASADGSFFFGDHSTSTLQENTTENSLAVRFAGGYRLYTNNTLTQGVTLTAGGNSWEVISDSTKKENFRPADGAHFLRKIAAMRLGSWNYRGQDKTRMRHYGPMAQDFFAAFGHDGVGTVGCDTLINQADFDGVNLIAIQALLREVEQLKAENARLNALEAENRDLRRLLTSLAADVRALKTAEATASR